MILSLNNQKIKDFFQNLDVTETNTVVDFLFNQLVNGDASISNIALNLGFHIPLDILLEVESRIYKNSKNMHLKYRVVKGYDNKAHKISESAMYYNALGVIKFYQNKLEIAMKLFNKSLHYLGVYEQAIINLNIATNQRVEKIKCSRSYIKKAI